MKTDRLKQARRLFSNPMAEPHTVRHNMRAWVRSVRLLGPHWRAHPSQYVGRTAQQEA